MSSSSKTHSKLTPLFWSDFAKNYWEKKALVVPNTQSPLSLIGEDEIFKLLVTYANQCRKAKNPGGFKFFIAGLRTYDEHVLELLPIAKDKSLLGYHSRMQAEFADYCLVCDELLNLSLERHAALAEFTAELYRHVGFPNRFSEMGLYLGNYRRTPFGVHVDSCGVFSFPVAGRKKFRLWTNEFVKKNPALNRAVEYSRFKKNSQLLEAQVGDMAYWPSAAWHIAESQGDFSATWSLGVWVDQPHAQVFAEGIKNLLVNKSTTALSTMTPFNRLHQDDGKVADLPTTYLKSIAALQRMTAREMKDFFLKSWMTHISKNGFKTLPLPRSVIGERSILCLRESQGPILWTKISRNFFFSYGGVLIAGTGSVHLLTLIKDLNRGKACKVSGYLKAPSRAADLKILKELARVGAF